MHADARKLLWDAMSAAERVERFCAGRTFDDYRRDELLRSAVERQLGIVGEALSRLRRLDAETAASIPELAEIVGFRNVLVHGYANIDDRIVFGVIERDIGPLKERLARMLA